MNIDAQGQVSAHAKDAKDTTLAAASTRPFDAPPPRCALQVPVFRPGLQAAGDPSPPVIPMHHLLVLLLALTAPPKALSLEAGEHNTAAMRFYDAGQLAPAVDEIARGPINPCPTLAAIEPAASSCSARCERRSSTFTPRP